MRILNLSGLFLSFVFCFFMSGFLHAQQGKINIQQDPKIVKLVQVKSQMNKLDDAEKKYKIQIYNGSLDEAKKAETEFKKDFNEWATEIVFETPNYKVRVGKFATRLEADRQLTEVKKKYESAFILIPK